MPIVISVANAKGGVGKSTLAYCLGCYYAGRNAKVAILDEDIQQTITDNIEVCTDRGEEVPLTLIKKSTLKSYTDLASRDEDIILVDTAPVETTSIASIYDVSDMVLIPIKPSTNDYNSLQRSLNTLREAMERNPDMIVAIVINMAVKSSTVQQAFRSAFEAEERIKVLNAELANRVIHTKYILETYSLFNTSDKMAKQEMAAVGDEIYYLLTL
ncbi:MAG: ParA family protein [Cyanobacteria bacterium J06649_11]